MASLQSFTSAPWPSLALLLVSAICALFWMGILITGRIRRASHCPLAPLPDRPEDEANGFVAVLCPGRNEAEHLARTLPAICAQTHVAHGLLFVDDQSEDASRTIATALQAQHDNLEVLANDTSPGPGWVGKCWAVHRGLARLRELEDTGRWPRAQWLCFTDADMDWEPTCLARALAHARATNAQVVSLIPRLTAGHWSEAVVLLSMFFGIALLYPFHLANRGSARHTLAAGGFILVRRDRYERIGGHEAVRDQVVEDVALGRALQNDGAKVQLAMGKEVLHARMYDGWWDLWEGLTKNSYAMLNYQPLALLGVWVSLMPITVFVPVWAVLGIMQFIAAPDLPNMLTLLLAAMALLASVQVMAESRRLVNLPRWTIVTMPLGMLLALILLTGSAWQYHFGRGNVWKGRHYGRDGVVE